MSLAQRRFLLQTHASINPSVGLRLHLTQVNEAVLKKVIEWCQHHRGDPPTTADDDSDSRKKTTDIDEWDQKFMQVDQEMLFEIILVSCSCGCCSVNVILICLTSL